MLDNDHGWQNDDHSDDCPERWDAMAQEPVDDKHQGRVEVTVGP